MSNLIRNIARIPLHTKLLFASIVLASLWLQSLNAFFMFSSFYLVFILCQWSRRTITFGPITRLLISFTLYILSLQIAITIGWVISPNYPLDLTIPLLFLCLILYTAVQYRKGKLRQPKTTQSSILKRITQDDIAAAATTFAFTIALIAFPLLNYSNSHPDLMLSFINNVDDSSHVAMINDRIQFNRGIMTNSDAASMTRSTGMYPAGWHSSIALIIKAFSPSISPGTATLKAYVFTKIALFSILVYATTRFSLMLASSFIIAKQRKGLMRTAVCVLSSVLLSVVIFDIFREGFYSFLPQLIGIMLAFILIGHVERSKQKSSDSYWAVAVAWFILISLSLAWMLVLPIMLIAFAVLLYHMYGRQMYGFIKDTLFFHPILVISPILAVIITYISMIGSSEAVSLSSAILNQGGIASYPLNIHLLLIASILIALYKPPKKISTLLFPAISAIFLLIFATGVLYYQTAAVGAPRYYYYKIIYVFMFSALPLTIGVLYKYVQKVAKISNTLGALALALLATVLFWQFVNPNTIAFIHGARHLSPEVRQSVYANIETYHRDSYTLYYIAGNSTVMDNAINLMHTNELSSECREKSWEAFLSGDDFPTILKRINQPCKDYRIKIIAASYSKPDIEKEFATNGKPNNIEVEYLYINPPKS